MTRLVAGACVFLNRPGFAGRARLRPAPCGPATGASGPWTSSPTSAGSCPCAEDPAGRGRRHITSHDLEWHRADWGEGGEEFHWWCTEAPEAFTAARPVYRSLEVELRAMVGNATYEAIAAYLDGRRDGTTGVAPHPAVAPIS